MDTDGDGAIDEWTDWRDIIETYGRIDGFAKVFSVDEAMLDLSTLPEGYGIQFEFSSSDPSATFDSVEIGFAAIPESATLFLLVVGGVVVYSWRRLLDRRGASGPGTLAKEQDDSIRKCPRSLWNCFGKSTRVWLRNETRSRHIAVGKALRNADDPGGGLLHANA